MATTLASLRDRVEIILADTTNAIYGTGDIDEAITRALHAYSLFVPQLKETSLTLTADGREISTASITDLITVTEIWNAYDSTDPDYPARTAPFRFWKDIEKIYVMGQYEPQSGDVLRVFYLAQHTLNGLDSETTTTIPEEDVSFIAEGAAGFAIVTRAADLTEQVTVDRDAVDRLHKLGQTMLTTYHTSLEALARQRQTPTAHVPIGPIDRFEDDWR